MSRERAPKASKKFKETITDAYDESDRTLSHEEAHRDAVYEPASTLSQIWTIYMTQMKKFTREKSIWILVVLLALIPVLTLALKGTGIFGHTDVANLYMCMLLTFLPFMTMLIASMLCGSMLPQEFNERTVYLSLPLPMDRSTFYFGKFLSGLTLSLGVVIAAYGVSFLMAITQTSEMYTFSLFSSLILSLCATTFFCSVAYFLSARSKRGSSMMPMLVLFFLMPLIGILLAYLGGKFGMPALGTLAGYIPCFAPDLAMTYLGNSSYGFISLYGIVTMMGILTTANVNLSLASSTPLMCIICIVLSVVLMYFGYRKMKGRDM